MFDPGIFAGLRLSPLNAGFEQDHPRFQSIGEKASYPDLLCSAVAADFAAIGYMLGAPRSRLKAAPYVTPDIRFPWIHQCINAAFASSRRPQGKQTLEHGFHQGVFPASTV